VVLVELLMFPTNLFTIVTLSFHGSNVAFNASTQLTFVSKRIIFDTFSIAFNAKFPSAAPISKTTSTSWTLKSSS